MDQDTISGQAPTDFILAQIPIERRLHPQDRPRLYLHATLRKVSSDEGPSVSDNINFTVPGAPVAKGRPRIVRRKHMSYPIAVTPKKTADYENRVRAAAAQAMEGTDLLLGPVFVEIVMLVPIPKSWSKKRQQLAHYGGIAATKKPDMDNIEKSILDAMNGVVFRDDSQVVAKSTVKIYDNSPRVLVAVEQLGTASA